MMKEESDQNDTPQPKYSIGEIMALLNVDERKVREFLVAAGVAVDPAKNDPEERIAYPDYRKLWISRANRPEGRLLAKLLVEESTSWFDKLFRT